MNRWRHVLCILLLTALAFVPGSSQARWLGMYKDSTNNAVKTGKAQVTDVHAPTWNTGDQSLPKGSGITILGDRFYTLAHYGQEATWPYDPSNDRVTIKAFEGLDGAPAWESENLDVGNTVAYTSTAAPTIDPASGFLYVGTGQSVQKVSIETGKVDKRTKLDASNTSPTVSSYQIINSCPTLGNGLVFIETFGGFIPENKQLVALDANTLDVVWFRNDQGQGQGAPCYVDNGLDKRVYTATTDGIACYSANATGELLWNNKTVAKPWQTVYSIYASLVYANGYIYAVTWPYNSWGEILCVDAKTGELKWKKQAPSTSFAPLVMKGKVYILGNDDAMLGHLATFDASPDPATGGELIDDAPQAIDGWSNFNNLMAATDDKIYLTDGAKLHVINAQTLQDESTISGGYDGPVAIDAWGGIYAHAGSAIYGFGKTVPVELSSFRVE